MLLTAIFPQNTSKWLPLKYKRLDVTGRNSGSNSEPENYTQPALTCSKLTRNTPQKCVKSIQSKQRHQNDLNNFNLVTL